MDEQRYLLMQQLGESEADGHRSYLAVIVNGERVLTRELAERAAAQSGTPGPRFLVPWADERGLEKFSEPERHIPMVLLEGDSLWRRGLPTYADLHGALKKVLDGAESPDPDTALLPVTQVIDVATERIGPGQAEDVQPHFDAYVMELSGRLDGDAYAVSVERLLLGYTPTARAGRFEHDVAVPAVFVAYSPQASCSSFRYHPRKAAEISR